MYSYSEERKQQIYKNWIERGRPWYNIDESKEATDEERKTALEMLQRQINKSKNDIELQKRAAVPRRVNQVKKFDRLMKGDY